ncbi:MAG: PQQ-like beta-propeller repeat protein [Acidobacteria bacterium]|nr:PQQ-like beta-propeller repeat protein [Acidobacteriota bacterium]
MKIIKDENKIYPGIICATALVLLISIGLTGCVASPKNNLTISASPSTAADDLVYFADNTGRINAVQNDGKLAWRYSLADDLAGRQNSEVAEVRIERLFARSGKKLYGLARITTGLSQGKIILFALDAEKLVWFEEIPAPEPNGSPLIIGDDGLYLAGNDGKLYAFSKTTGKILWENQVSSGRLGAPTLGADGIIYVTGLGHHLHAINADGTERWAIGTSQ